MLTIEYYIKKSLIDDLFSFSINFLFLFQEIIKAPIFHEMKMFIIVDILPILYIYSPLSLIKVWKAVNNVYFVFNNLTCIAISPQHNTFIKQ